MWYHTVMIFLPLNRQKNTKVTTNWPENSLWTSPIWNDFSYQNNLLILLLSMKSSWRIFFLLSFLSDRASSSSSSSWEVRLYSSASVLDPEIKWIFALPAYNHATTELLTGCKMFKLYTRCIGLLTTVHEGFAWSTQLKYKILYNKNMKQNFKLILWCITYLKSF